VAATEGPPPEPASDDDHAHPGELVVEDVSVAFGGVKAVSDVFLRAAPGEILGIIGPNGAGKTTLLNCISGVQPHSGRILLDGRLLSGQDARAIRRAGLTRTFQHPSLVGDLTVVENVSVGASSGVSAGSLGGLLPTRASRRDAQVSRRRANAALDLLGFPQSRRTVLAAELPLAEQKTVDVARAIASRPAVILLDEPTAGLDETEMHGMATALRSVRDSGVTIVVVAHHIEFLRGIVDRLVVLEFGRTLAEGPPDEVLRHERVVETYIGASSA
jgi:branched-chain amino acid transport system permease protein